MFGYRSTGFPTSSQMDTLLKFAQSFEQHNYPDINLEEGNSHKMASIRAGSLRKREATTTAVFASEEPPETTTEVDMPKMQTR
jgi:hypothetical protein